MNVSPVLEKLRAAGYKITRPRERLAQVLEETDRHTTIEELYDLVNDQGFLISQATVYRNVRLLEELNLLVKIDLGDGMDRYELKTPHEDHHHHHLVCNYCKLVKEVHGDFLDKLELELEERFDFEILDHKLTFYGICSSCKKRMEKNE